MPDINKILSISNQTAFKKQAFEVFRFQYQNNPVYQQFCNLLNVHPEHIDSLQKIPFLPIQFFKTHKVVSSEKNVQMTFTSSGTTGSSTSKHHLTDLSIYRKSFRNGFDHFYGEISDYIILALLPSYLEREGSSLIFMVEDLIIRSNNKDSGFYLHDLPALQEKLIKFDKAGRKVLLIGVSFALLDLVENYSFQLKNTIVMETGGMKGRRKEMIRRELHDILEKGFSVKKIHSEYGMTELLSQAYSAGEGIFEPPPWMQFSIRDPEDAISSLPMGKSGGLNIIDLANIYSCSFIATQDLAKVGEDGRAEILGRFDNSDIRGCNLMVL